MKNNKTKIATGMITMYRPELVEMNLRHVQGYFDKIVVILGAADDIKTQEICKKYNAVCIIKPWTCHKDAYQGYLDYLESLDGDWWFCYFDDDEIPTKRLMRNLHPMIDESNNGEKFNLVWLPNIHMIGGRRRNTSEECRNFLDCRRERLFRKPIFMKYKSGMKPEIANAGHITLAAWNSPNWKPTLKPYPYIHWKSIKTIVESGIYSTMVDPTFYSVSVKDAKTIIDTFKHFGITDMVSMRKKFKEGLDEKFESTLYGWHTRYPYDHMMSRYYMLYFYWNHPDKLVKYMDDRLEVYEYYKAVMDITDEQEWAYNEFFTRKEKYDTMDV